MSEKPRLIEVRGISKPDFQQWKHHPVTQVVWAFLKDHQEQIKHIALERWLDTDQGLGDDRERNTLRGQVIELEDLMALEFENLLAFYEDTDDDGRPEQPAETTDERDRV